ncbi:hypothetical protein RhiirA4_415249 [Rhizophagus irregularis]|uniref:Uncharacterized protein n=1 Tax=Rhizophagus irregularis TaxID=588596 RepID=A0A2I1FZB1_9GLOM|nr:hypothetical protein RhiirA4_415249 [Rhizophagus irregularis]
MSNYPGQNDIKEYKKETLAPSVTSHLNKIYDIKSDIFQPDIKEYKKENLAPSVTYLNKISDIKSDIFQPDIKEYKKENLAPSVTYLNKISDIKSDIFQPDIKEYKKENLAPSVTYLNKISDIKSDIFQPDIKEYKKENLAPSVTYLNKISDIKSDNFQPDIKEYKKENLAPSVTSHLNKISNIKSSEILQSDRIIKEHKKENLVTNVTSHLNKTSDIKSSEISQPDSIKKGKLKRVRDDNTDTESLSNEHWKKQSQILKQNKNNLAYIQVVDNALLVASAYESLIADNIIPFIKILKTFLSSRSRMSLSSANEPVLQAIVENLLPLKYCIPELSLVINGKKQKGSGRFGYSDIFILSSEGDNNVILELKYIPLVGLINSNQKNNIGANELENLDQILEKENEESVLKRSYTYWSKEEKKTNMTTIGETLNNGLNKLNLYMETISKGKAKNYSSSGVFDERVKITKSKPNKLKGFVILVIGFRRILWKSTNEVTTNYIYNKI